MEVIKGPDFRIFLTFLVISALIWSIERLRQSYTIEIDYDIECTNIPDEYVVKSLNNAIHAVVSGEGIDLLRLPNNRKRKISVDLSKLVKRNVNGQTMSVLIPRRYNHEVAATLPDHITLENIEADTVYIPLLTKTKKMLPVVVRDNITLETQYMFSSPRELSPDSVWVSGTNDMIDTMKAVYTMPLDNITLHDTISLSVNFDKPKDVEISALDANVTYFVEPFTEKDIDVPITAINIPDGYNFKAFPPKVHVKMQTGLSKFDRIVANDIDIVADLQDIKPGSNQQKIKLKLSKTPEGVRDITYTPIFVEYLLEKQRIRINQTETEE